MQPKTDIFQQDTTNRIIIIEHTSAIIPNGNDNSTNKQTSKRNKQANMAFGKARKAAPAQAADAVGGEDAGDPTAWIIDNEFANFVLMNTNEIVS